MTLWWYRVVNGSRNKPNNPTDSTTAHTRDRDWLALEEEKEALNDQLT